MSKKKRAYKRKKVKVVEESTPAKNIMEWFLYPLFDSQISLEYKQWLDFVFKADERPILVFTVKNDFWIKANIYITAISHMKMQRPNKVKKGTLVFARFDRQQRHKIDLEVQTGRGGRTRVLHINRTQWIDIRPNLELKDI